MSDKLLSVKDVANRFEVSTTAVYDWIKKGEIESVRTGVVTKRIFVTEESVDRFEERRKRLLTLTDEEGEKTPYMVTA